MQMSEKIFLKGEILKALDEDLINTTFLKKLIASYFHLVDLLSNFSIIRYLYIYSLNIVKNIFQKCQGYHD